MSEEAPLVDAALEGESGNAVIYDDPMKQVFDAVVIGTGITEAIVAG